MAGVKIETDALDLAFVLAGVQKAFALPAGLTVAAVSEDALARAETVPPRSYYFSLPQMAKYHRKNQTPSTPAIPQMFALNAQLTAMLEEGLEARFDRHAAMAKTVQAWAKTHFDIYPEEGYWSNTLTCVRNTREIDVAQLIQQLAQDYNFRLANGYGPIKGETFRIAHMGDTQPDEIAGVLRAIETVLGL
jgi:aspartate aminotransferase-like enzyme